MSSTSSLTVADREKIVTVAISINWLTRKHLTSKEVAQWLSAHSGMVIDVQPTEMAYDETMSFYAVDAEADHRIITAWDTLGRALIQQKSSVRNRLYLGSS